MSIKKDNVNVTAVIYNNQDVNKVILDNNCVWCRPFTYTQGTLPTGVASLTCRRSSTDEPSASTGEISNNGTIYYYDKLYWDATASAGYRITAVRGSGSPVTVSGAITGTTASGVASARISGTISQGALPAEVASITCYRKAYNENSFSEYTGSTIYYGDQFYWTATAKPAYNSPSLIYNNSSKVYTWTGSQGGSINSVSASGLSAGTRKSFTISFGTSVNKTLYGSWSSSSQTAYYGDKITVSGTTVTCYKWEATSTARWTVTVSAYPNDAQYTYSAPTIVESATIASVTAAATITAYNKRTLNSYTVTFSTTSGRYGSWGTTSISNVPYGTTITRNGNTVTVGNAGSSTFVPAGITVQYNYASPTFSVPSSVTGATTVTGGCERSDRLYTIQWIGENGSTVLETDSNVKYGAVLTYNGSTPSKPSTAQYSYAFSAWKLGSTSGSTVTSGSTTNAGSTSSTTINIYSTFTSTVRSYTITWKYMSAYGSWTTATQSYNYGATPSRTLPDTVYSGNWYQRYTPLNWDDLGQVTGNRTITCNYKHQIYYDYNETRCTYRSGTTAGWYDGTSLSYSTTFTSDSGYAFNNSGIGIMTFSGTTEGGVIYPTASYIKITASSSNTNGFVSTSSTATSGSTSIWVASGTTVYMYAKLKSFVSSVPSTWQLKDGTALCPNALYLVSSDAYKYPGIREYSATITTNSFWCAHRNTTYSNRYDTSRISNAARWSGRYYLVNDSFNVFTTHGLKMSSRSIQSGTYKYYNNFNITGPSSVSFKAEYTLSSLGLTYEIPTYVLHRVSTDGTTTSSAMSAGSTKDLTTGYLWVLTIERPEGKEDTTTT